LLAVNVISVGCFHFCYVTASIILDVGRSVKVTASTIKLQHILNMVRRFHSALLPVVKLAKSATYDVKAAEGNIVLPQTLHFI